jgi:hypothetical protein
VHLFRRALWKRCTANHLFNVHLKKCARQSFVHTVYMKFLVVFGDRLMVIAAVRSVCLKSHDFENKYGHKFITSVQIVLLRHWLYRWGWMFQN